MSLWKDIFKQPWKIKDVSLSTGFARVNIDRELDSKYLVSAYRFGFTFAKLAWGFEKRKTPEWVTLTNQLSLSENELNLPDGMTNQLIDLLEPTEYDLSMENAAIGAKSIQGIYSMLQGIHGTHCGEACHLGYSLINVIAQLEIFMHRINHHDIDKDYIPGTKTFLTDQMEMINESVEILKLKSLPKDFQFDFSNTRQSYNEFCELGPLFDMELRVDK